MALKTVSVKLLKQLGFDRSYYNGHAHVAHCSQCQVMVINGHPTHEGGCPNGRRQT